jgi:hypothetical protein
MPNDPALNPDKCIYMEASQGDGGVHNGNDTWWLSPDIKLTGPTSGLDKADPGQNNTVDVIFHMQAAILNECVLPAGTESITAEFWVGNPSLAMTPDNPASTKKIDAIGSPVPADGASVTKTFIWNPPTGLDPADPQSSGHKCLIARCYPDPLVPSATSFFVPDDPHVAQHNICIVPCGGPGAARRPGPCGFEVATVNPNRERAQKVLLRAVVDLHPGKFVERVVLERVKGAHGFKRLATRPPQGFSFELPDFPRAEVTDNTKLGCLGLLLGGKDRRSCDAQIEFKPGQFTKFRFIADLSGAELGDAYIFHLRQIGEDKRDQGGLTIVMIAV